MKPSYTAKDTLKVIAHRGASKLNPENTRAAFDGAIIPGVFGIELDLQLTQDHIVVVYHDKTLSRIKAGKKPIHSFTYAQLLKMDFGRWFHRKFENERIITLQELFHLYAHKTNLFLELKERSYEGNIMLADLVINDIVAHGLEKTTFILCFDRHVLAYCIRKHPSIHYIHNLAKPARKTRSIVDLYEQLYAVCIHLPALTTHFSNFMYTLNKPIYVFTCNRKKDVENASYLGAEGLMSDNPGWLVHYLKERQPYYET